MSYLLDTAGVFWYAFKPLIIASTVIIVGTLTGAFYTRHQQKRHIKYHE